MIQASRNTETGHGTWEGGFEETRTSGDVAHMQPAKGCREGVPEALDLGLELACGAGSDESRSKQRQSDCESETDPEDGEQTKPQDK